MTAPIVAPQLPAPTPAPIKKKRVLLLDLSTSKREMRAEIMRRVGIEVDSAADIIEARSWWRADLYDLVLIDVANEQGDRDKFCEDIGSATPRQRFAFFVGKPEYLANSPGADKAPLAQLDNEQTQPPNGDVRHSPPPGDLPLRWGILEASRRISAVRSASVARTQAMRNRPSPPRDPETRYSKYSAVSRTLDSLLREDVQ